MAGYFRQLAERTIAPTSGLRPLSAAFAARPQPMAEEIYAPTEPASHLFGAADRSAADTAPRSMPHDEPADPPAANATGKLPPPAASEADMEDRPAHLQPIEPAIVTHRRQASASMPEAAPERAPPTEEEDRRSSAVMPALPPPSAARLSTPLRSPVRPQAAKATTAPSGRRDDPGSRIADADTAPEVHIHIGRIELTAIAPSKPVRPESAPAKRPMSLDEYLEHRGKAS